MTIAVWATIVDGCHLLLPSGSTATMRFESLEDRHLLTGNVELVADLGTGAVFSPLDFPQGVSVIDGQAHFFQRIRQQGTAIGLELRRVVGQSSEVVESWLTTDVASNFADTVHVVDSSIYFTVSVGGADELRRFDATASSSELVQRFETTETNITQLVATDSGVFFVATTPSSGTELYFVPDNEVANEVALLDVYPGGIEFQGTFEAFSSEPSELLALGDKLVFIAKNELGDNGEVWVSDGTDEGTQILQDIFEGSSGSAPSDLTVLDGWLFFTASENGSGRSLWLSDGTPEGTEVIEEPDFDDESVELLGVHEERVFYVVNDEYWWRSPSGLTQRIARTLGDTQFGFVNGRLFENDGEQLWSTDEEGNFDVVHINDEQTAARYSDFHFTTHGRFGFVVNGREFWTTDGTELGTARIAASSGSISRSFSFAARDYYLVGFDSGEFGVWSTDWVTPLRSFFNAVPRETVIVDEGFWISGNIGRGPEIWFSDGTASAPTVVQPVPLGNQSAFATVWESDLGNDLLFFHRPGDELWVTDGTEAGTRKLGDLPSLRTNTAPETLRQVKGGIVFSVEGTNSTTSQYFADNQSLRKLGDFDVEQIAAVNNKLLLVEISTRRLLSIDFATLEVEELASQVQGSSEISVVDGLAYFVSGSELWSTDGSLEGTKTLTELPSQSATYDFVSREGRVFFILTTDELGELSLDELWTTDNTAVGTQPLAVAPSGRRIEQLAQLGDRLVAFATVEGLNATTEVIEYREGESVLQRSATVSGQGRILLNENRTHFALESSDGSIWVSDGTEAGTRLASTPDITIGPLAAGQRDFFFTASKRDSETGVREYSIRQLDPQTGAVEAILEPTLDLVLTPMSHVLDGDLVFLAWDMAVGSELRRIAISKPEFAGDTNNDGQVDFADFLIFSQNFGKTRDAVFSEGDFDGDGDVDFADFLLLSENFGKRL